MQVPRLVAEALSSGARSTNLTLVLDISRQKQQVVAAGIIVSHWRGNSCRQQMAMKQAPLRSMAPAAAARERWWAAISAVRAKCKVRGNSAFKKKIPFSGCNCIRRMRSCQGIVEAVQYRS